MMELLPLKLLFMGVIFMSTTLVGISPILLKGAFSEKFDRAIRPQTRARILSLASCFSAGVFMCVCFIGLLPAADQKFHDIMQVKYSSVIYMYNAGKVVSQSKVKVCSRVI